MKTERENNKTMKSNTKARKREKKSVLFFPVERKEPRKWKAVRKKYQGPDFSKTIKAKDWSGYTLQGHTS